MLYVTLYRRLEAGFFFVPEMQLLSGLLRNRENDNYNKRARWKLCALESHWHVQNVSSVTTT